MTDYYYTLGVDKTATDKDIRKAYIRLANKYHPDKNLGDKTAEVKFKDIKEAYEVLSDRGSRVKFDSNNASSAFYKKSRTQKTFVYEMSLQDAYTGTVFEFDGHTLFVPAGVRSGNKIYCAGNFVEIKVSANKKFLRSQDDLLVDLHITAIEAMLGIEVVLKHLDGNKVKFNIHPGIQYGQVIRLSGKGMPNPELDKNGDLLIRCNITIPDRLTSGEKQLVKNLHSYIRTSIEQ